MQILVHSRPACILRESTRTYACIVPNLSHVLESVFGPGVVRTCALQLKSHMVQPAFGLRSHTASASTSSCANTSAAAKLSAWSEVLDAERVRDLSSRTAAFHFTALYVKSELEHATPILRVVPQCTDRLMMKSRCIRPPGRDST